MSWTTPRTWVTDEVITSSLLNTHVRDNELALPHPYDYAPADVDVVNTVTETSLWSKLITGGDLGPNGLLHLTLLGDLLYNNSTLDTATVRFKFGGATVLGLGLGTPGIQLNAARRPWIYHVLLSNRGASNSQLLHASFGRAHDFPDASPGIGGGSSVVEFGQATAAVDTTVDQTFEVTAQWNAASVNDSFRKRSGVLYLARN